VQKSNILELPQFRLISNDTMECLESYGSDMNGNANIILQCNMSKLNLLETNVFVRNKQVFGLYRLN